MVRGKSKIPDRWEDYKSLGQKIPDTRFICCKCPLKEDLCQKLSSRSKWFTPQDLFRSLAEDNFNLGLIIDLTNTDRYYSPGDFTYANVEYSKIYTPGHDVPGKDAIEIFTNTVKLYERKIEGKDNLIAVHCTHGVNRTGYMVCHYLIESCGWTYEKAVQTFNLARGHPVERENYLEALKELENRIAESKDLVKLGLPPLSRKRHHSNSSSSSSSSNSSATSKDSNASSTSSADSLFKPKMVPITMMPRMIPPMMPMPPPAMPARPPFNMDPSMMQRMYATMMQGAGGMFSNFYNSTPTPARPPVLRTLAPVGLDPNAATPPALTRQSAEIASLRQALAKSDQSSTSSGSTSDDASDTDDDSGSSAAEEGCEEAETLEGEAADEGDEAAIAGTSANPDDPPADWELGGKVDKKSAARKRRERQQRLRHMHKTMQSGQFWKIREMQREKYGF